MTNTVQIPRTASASLRLAHPLILLAEAFSTRRDSRDEDAPHNAGSNVTGSNGGDTGRRDPDVRAGDRPPADADELPPPRREPRAAFPIPLPGEPVDTSQHRPTRPSDGQAPAERAPDRER